MSFSKGKSQRLVAEKFEVANCTVCDVWKDHTKVEDCVSSSDSLVLAKKGCIIHLTLSIQLAGSCFVNCYVKLWLPDTDISELCAVPGPKLP